MRRVISIGVLLNRISLESKNKIDLEIMWLTVWEEFELHLGDSTGGVLRVQHRLLLVAYGRRILRVSFGISSLHSLQFNLQLWMCETWFCEVSATKSFDHGKSFEIFDQWKIKTKEEIVDFCDKFCQFQGCLVNWGQGNRSFVGFAMIAAYCLDSPILTS